MGQAKRSDKPHFVVCETGFPPGSDHKDLAVGDRLMTVLDGCMLCGRLAGVRMCPGEGVYVTDTDGGWSTLYARLGQRSGASGLFFDGAGNRLCAGCIARHGRPLTAELHRRLDDLNDKIWPELCLRYDCALCEIQWIRTSAGRTQ
jgi:hypothetical protein